MTAPSAHAYEWRAFVGPPFRASSASDFWDWTALTANSPYDPEAVIPSTTLGTALSVTTLSFHLSDATGWPTEGGFWVAGTNTAQTWGYCRYTALNTGTGLGTITAHDAVDSEYTGLHGTGAEVRFWWPISTDDGRLSVREYVEGNLVGCNWTARTQGYAIPLAALRIGHLFLLQSRSMDFGTGAWGSWTNRLIGWIDNVRAEDDADKERRWQIEVVSLAGILNQLEVDGVRVGNEELQEGASAVASSTLAQAYKAYGDGEFEGADPQLSPSNAVDQRNTPPWVSERYVGQTNTPANPGTAYDGVAAAADVIVSQAHLRLYPGQAPGYRWIELTVLDSVGSLEAVLVYSKTSTSGSLNGDPYTIDYFVDLGLVSGLNQAWDAGDRIIIAENAALFEAENPDHDAAAVIDGADIGYGQGIAEHYRLSVQGATTGSFKLDDTVPFGTSSSDIFWDDDADTVANNVDVNIGGRVHGYGGPFPDDDIFLVIEEDPNANTYGGNIELEVIDEVNLTATCTKIIEGNAGFSTGHLPGVTGVDWFGLISTTEGILTLYDGAGFGAWSTVQWGTGTLEPGQGGDNLWGSASNLATGGLTEGYTLRYIYDPDNTLGITADSADDYWQHSKIHTPGYESNGTEWLLVELPGMGLSLAADANAGATSLSIQDASETAAVNGLDDSGTVQIGGEQIAYTTIDRSAGTISGFTTTQDHSEGDPVFFVSGGVATDALPVDSIKFKRLTGTPKLYTFTMRYSPYMLVRTPDDGTYTPDYTGSTAVTAETGTNYSTATEGEMYVGTLDLSGSNPRIKWLLVEISVLDDGAGNQPQRASVNEIEFVFDVDVFDSSSYLPDTTTVYGTIDQLLQNALIPSGAYSDNTTATAVSGYTTEKGMLWPILLDLADFGNRQINCTRGSRLLVFDNTLWVPGSSDMDGELPAEEGNLTRDNVRHHEFNWVNGRNVGAVDLTWRTPDGADEGTETFPTTHYFGATETIGPYIYANAGAAGNAARRHFWMLRRPHNVIFEIAGDGRTYRPLQVHGGTWNFGTGYNTLDRTYLIEAVDHDLENNEWNGVVQAIQISREDDR